MAVSEDEGVPRSDMRPEMDAMSSNWKVPLWANARKAMIVLGIVEGKVYPRCSLSLQRAWKMAYVSDVLVLVEHG
jgi:hypothetical protein